MNRVVFIVAGMMLHQFAVGQNIGFADLTALLEMKSAKVDNHLQKKGFKKNGFSSNDPSFHKIAQVKDVTVVRSVQVILKPQSREIEFTTTSQPEWKELENEILAAGFVQTKAKTDSSSLFQKQNLLLTTVQEIIDSTVRYSITINKKILPTVNTIIFAEDLLQIDSHEYLAEVFGKQNVLREIFFLSPTDKKNCTIIFPNSVRQAIFLWSDEESRRGVSFIIFGEQLNAKRNNDLNVVQLSHWRSRQGVYCGMALGEIQQLNKAPLRFYNWNTESAGFMAPKNEGVIDFDLLKPVFNCMNCNFLYIDDRSEIIQSPYSLSENQKVYVAGFVVAPEKEEIPVVSKK
ncbi:MAG: hypothetical protein V4676_05070 [Bacteroidota bacterium]